MTTLKTLKYKVKRENKNKEIQKKRTLRPFKRVMSKQNKEVGFTCIRNEKPLSNQTFVHFKMRIKNRTLTS